MRTENRETCEMAHFLSKTLSFCKNEVFHPSLFIHQFFAFLFIEFQFAITLIVNKNYIYFIYLDSIFFNHTLWVLVSFAAFTLNTFRSFSLARKLM